MLDSHQMRSFTRQTWFFVLLSSILQVVIFPVAGPLPYGRAVLAWVALTPLLVVLLRDQSLRVRDGAFLAYSCGCLWYLGTCYWVYSTMHLYGHLNIVVSAFAMVLFCLYLGLYHALFGALLVWIRVLGGGAKGIALLAAPFLWVAVELARARVTSFPWDLLGYAAIDNHVLTRLAPWGGVYLLSFVLLCGNALLASWWLLPDPKRVRLLAGAGALLAIVISTAGAVHATAMPQQQAPYTAVLLQPNLNVGQDDAASQQINPLADAMRQTLTDTKRQVTLWPESPAPYRTDDPNLKEQWMLLAARTQAPLIAGAVGVDADPHGSLFYNSAVFIDPVDGYTGRYNKIHLVPFGEFLPFAPLFSFAGGLTQEVGLFERGTSRAPFYSGGNAYGVFLCYESIFGDEVRQFVLRGASVLVNLSDDGWYGDSSAPFQHLNMARMRAIENHRWLLRDTNTGITAAIDPYGRVLQAIPRHQDQADVVQFNFSKVATLYTRWGDWFAFLCCGVAGGLGALSYICKMKTC